MAFYAFQAFRRGIPGFHQQEAIEGTIDEAESPAEVEISHVPSQQVKPRAGRLGQLRRLQLRPIEHAIRHVDSPDGVAHSGQRDGHATASHGQLEQRTAGLLGHPVPELQLGAETLWKFEIIEVSHQIIVVDAAQARCDIGNIYRLRLYIVVYVWRVFLAHRPENSPETSLRRLTIAHAPDACGRNSCVLRIGSKPADAAPWMSSTWLSPTKAVSDG